MAVTMAHILLPFGFVYRLHIANGVTHFRNFRSVEDDGQSVKGEYYFTYSFFLLFLRCLLFFLLPLL